MYIDYETAEAMHMKCKMLWAAQKLQLHLN